MFYNLIGFEGVVLGFGLSMLIFSSIVLKQLKNTKIDFKILKPRFGFMINNYLSSDNSHKKCKKKFEEIILIENNESNFWSKYNYEKWTIW